MTKTEIIISIICAILGSSALNGFISHILYNKKLKKELKFKGNDMTAKEIEKSLQFVRNMELKLTVQDIYDIEEEIKERGCKLDLFNGECLYPAIFNNWDTYNNFAKNIFECRNKHEKNLSCKIALNIVFIDRYISQLMLYIKDNGEKDLPFWGTIFIYDLQKWQSKFDKMIVKELNRYTYKLESHETIKWKLLRKRELEKPYKKTILYYLLNDKCRHKDKKIMLEVKDIINQFLENIKE